MISYSTHLLQILSIALCISIALSLSSPPPSNRSGRRSPARTRGRPSITSSSTTDSVSAQSSAGPKGESTRERRRSRPTRAQQDTILFDPKALTKSQVSNENAIPLDLYSSGYVKKSSFLRLRPQAAAIELNPETTIEVEISLKEKEDGDAAARKYYLECRGREVQHDHFERFSLDDLFPNLDFGRHFYTNGDFRQAIRTAMREDVFYTTPAYAKMSPKVAAMILDDDSSLQGTWNCVPKSLPEGMTLDDLPLRMTRLTKVLEDTLGPKAPTGDAFMMKIGGLCGLNPSSHWIDIIGVKDRAISHSWHQDAGKSYVDDLKDQEGNGHLNNSRYTVTLGFPIEDDYTGTGVFSHALKLEQEHLAPNGHNTNEPVLFEGTADDKYIIRPEFALGKEILRSRDIDVLHSAPDVVYRRSLMRFM
eukprot:CAMPEP_0194086624 /NCGR_PEP_ID=MMETSP0149-20130528/21833_1 /TAXON_ID=122233 /ORGANISM="Chaetoceros debilis, Strain MM31A-1" /LENGTH=419 /DNA_ID=CAMNT_0038769753 /DNA_START=9 /DNA_END=1268 /DNA_ORIENTATION=-